MMAQVPISLPEQGELSLKAVPASLGLPTGLPPLFPLVSASVYMEAEPPLAFPLEHVSRVIT